MPATSLLIRCSLALAAGLLPSLAATAQTPPPAAPPPAANPADADQVEESALIHGVQVSVRVYSKDPAPAKTAALAAIQELNRLFDKYDQQTRESETKAINSAAATEEVLVSEETYALLTRMLDLCRRTSGAFDPTVASYDFLWNFSMRPLVRPLPDEIAVRRKMTGCDKIVLKPVSRAVRLAQPGSRITFSGVLRGYALERSADVLRKANLNDFRIRVGNDVFVSGRVGTRHWLAGVPNTRRPDDEPQMVYLSSHAAITVSDSDRYVVKAGKRYHDGLDPRTGMPAEGTVQATVIGSDPLMVAAMAHAVFVLGPKAGMALLNKEQQAQGFTVDTAGKVAASAGIGDFAHLPPKFELQ